MNRLDVIASEIRACKLCFLHKGRINAVPGEGYYKARLMVIGEAPGREENKQGRPFVGKAGKLLDEILDHANISRNEIFITNIVKCRPPDNRRPTEKEAETCADRFLIRQIDYIKPRVICLLGNVPLNYLLGKENITKRHGKWEEHNGIIYFPTFHPAAAIYNRKLIPILKKDFKEMRKLL